MEDNLQAPGDETASSQLFSELIFITFVRSCLGSSQRLSSLAASSAVADKRWPASRVVANNLAARLQRCA